MQNKFSKIIASVAALLIAATSLQAFDYIRNDEGPRATNLPLRWQQPVFPMRLMLGTTPTYQDGSNPNTSVEAAMQAWNPLLGAIQFQGTVASGTPGDGNRINEIAFASKIYDRDFGADTLAVTTTWYVGNERTEADILFNTAKTFNSYRGNTQSQLGSDIRRVALHELGHALGLDHPDEASPVQTITAVMNSRVGNVDALAADDITGAQNLYGPPGVPANNNFANATTLTSSATITVTGYNTNATKETGEPNHAANSGGRSVWWKWTSPAPGPVSLDTRGSYYDTTLGVYTGTAVDALTNIASSDDITNGIVQASDLTFTAVAGTTYYFAVDGFRATGDTYIDQAGIILNLRLTATGSALPTITSQPVSVSVVAGSPVAFSVAATAGTAIPTYQWQKNGVAISGATSASYSIASAQTSDAGNYTVVVTSPTGSVTSNAATLTVTSPPVVNPPTGGGGSGGGGGGGGSPSWWFVAAITLLAAARRFFGSRQ